MANKICKLISIVILAANMALAINFPPNWPAVKSHDCKKPKELVWTRDQCCPKNMYCCWPDNGWVFLYSPVNQLANLLTLQTFFFLKKKHRRSSQSRPCHVSREGFRMSKTLLWKSWQVRWKMHRLHSSVQLISSAVKFLIKPRLLREVKWSGIACCIHVYVLRALEYSRIEILYYNSRPFPGKKC